MDDIVEFVKKGVEQGYVLAMVGFRGKAGEYFPASRLGWFAQNIGAVGYEHDNRIIYLLFKEEADMVRKRFEKVNEKLSEPSKIVFVVLSNLRDGLERKIAINKFLFDKQNVLEIK